MTTPMRSMSQRGSVERVELDVFKTLHKESKRVKIFLAFLVVSTTSLLPYNLYMNARQYFFFKLRNVSSSDLNATYGGYLGDDVDEHHTHLQHVFEGWIALSSGIFCICGAALNVLCTNSMSNGFRVLGGHATVLLAFAPTLIFTFVNTDSYQHTFFWASMALASLASFGSMGLIGGGILGLAATFPETYIQAVMFGQALAGVLSSGLSIACQIFASDELSNGRVYFAIAAIWTIASVGAYFVLVNSHLSGEMQLRANSAMDRRHLLDDGDSDEETRENEQIDSMHPIEMQKIGNAWREVSRQAGPELLSAFFVLFVTLSAFPAVASLVITESKNETWQAYFSAVCCFFVFNIGDAIGRVLARAVEMSRCLLLCFSLSRIIFIPLILLCNVDPRSYTSTLLPSDGLFIVIMILFAVSNGCVLTVSSVAATRSVSVELKEVTGSIFGLVVATSALIGSLIGVILVGVL